MDGAWPFDDAPKRPELNKIAGSPPHEEYQPLNQLTNLRSIESGPGSIPTINATRLAAQGLIEKTGESSGARGYAHCRITDAGKAALIAA